MTTDGEDDKEDQEEDYFLEPWREEDIRGDLLVNFDTLKEKTLNFEELLNDLVRQGALSFEEKFKILSGIIDETTTNKTIPEKCNELYHTLLVKRKIPMVKLFKCWEETGNTFLVGRFDTHFTLEGRDSKALKFHKFKALPSYRTEWLTHLRLKQLQLSPHALLKCLRKSSHLVSIRLERIKVPHGGRSSDDPSSGFDQPLALPGLKDFFFEEVSIHEAVHSVKEALLFLDELNLKPILFFGLNPRKAWETGVRIEVKMRGATLLKMLPEDGEFVSMLRRRPEDYGGFFNPNPCPHISLYECYVPKVPFGPALTHVIIYRCKASQFDVLLRPCVNLVEATLYGEHETNPCSLDLGCLPQSLTKLTVGFVSLSLSSPDPAGLTLDHLCLDTCILSQEDTLSKAFTSIDKLILVSCNPSTLLQFTHQQDFIKKEINVYQFSWEEDTETLFQNVIPRPLDKCPNFSLEKSSEQTFKSSVLKSNLIETLFELGRFSAFVPTSNNNKSSKSSSNNPSSSSWFFLPGRAEEGDIRDGFRVTHGF